MNKTPEQIFKAGFEAAFHETDDRFNGQFYQEFTMAYSGAIQRAWEQFKEENNE